MTFLEALEAMFDGKQVTRGDGLFYKVKKGIMDTDLMALESWPEGVNLAFRRAYDHGDRGCTTEEAELMVSDALGLVQARPSCISFKMLLATDWRVSAEQ